MKRLYTVISSLVIAAAFLSAEKMPLVMDIIAATHVIRDGDTIVSGGGSFVMGFFSPGNSKNRYVGIWYNKVSVPTPVWVANREAPLTNTLGLLKFIEPGILVLLNESNSVIWSANTSSAVKTPVAQLLDSGNLIVKEANDDTKNFLWQSFDNPTDTLLPGMKLGWNYAADVEFYLSSWRSYDDPGIGDFTYHCEPTGYPQNVLRKGKEKRYSTGPWNGLTFSGLPGLRRNPVFTFGLVMNVNEVFYHYELVNTSEISRFTLSENGVGQRWSWNDQTQSWRVYLTAPTDNCDFYNLCGSYGVCSTSVCGCLYKFVPRDEKSWEKGSWSSGCVHRTPLNCRTDGFLKYSGIKLPDTEHSWYNRSMNLEECKELCFKNCSCTAYTIVDVNAGGHTCLLWFTDLVDIKELSKDGQEIYIRIAASELESKGIRRNVVIMVSVMAATALLMLCVGLILYFHRRKKTDLLLGKGGSFRGEVVKDFDEGSHSKDLELPLFDLSTISKATDNFSFSSKIGEGGFGPVYKGVLEEGQEIAVKRLSRTSLQGVNEFKNEVICVAKLQHRNLVKLLGCCISGEEYLLIYEYMPNRSLDLILFDPLKTKLLDWPNRFRIINGIARGLLYLHQDSCLRIIHRDLKASNVLLDSDMNPKISDFGLARSFGGNETGANTTRVVGTYGYMSPEYAVDGLFSVKSDVFSFGVLVLEIVSGKRNRGFSHRDHYLNLLGHAWMLHKEGNTLELIKSYPVDPDSPSEVMRVIHVGLLCVQQSPEDRPTMSSVVLMLGNEGELPHPKKPGFFTERDVTDTETSFSSLSALHSTNEISITVLQPR